MGKVYEYINQLYWNLLAIPFSLILIAVKENAQVFYRAGWQTSYIAYLAEPYNKQALLKEPWKIHMYPAAYRFCNILQSLYSALMDLKFSHLKKLGKYRHLKKLQLHGY